MNLQCIARARFPCANCQEMRWWLFHQQLTQSLSVWCGGSLCHPSLLTKLFPCVTLVSKWVNVVEPTAILATRATVLNERSWQREGDEILSQKGAFLCSLPLSCPAHRGQTFTACTHLAQPLFMQHHSSWPVMLAMLATFPRHTTENFPLSAPYISLPCRHPLFILTTEWCHSGPVATW